MFFSDLLLQLNHSLVQDFILQLFQKFGVDRFQCGWHLALNKLLILYFCEFLFEAKVLLCLDFTHLLLKQCFISILEISGDFLCKSFFQLLLEALKIDCYVMPNTLFKLLVH